MNLTFDTLLTDIEALTGLELQAITESTPPITIEKINKDEMKYVVISGKSRSTRTFGELEKIWNELLRTKYVNVDQALSGSGSSRNQPETILANLPYIEHFKYNRKKHLHLLEESSHPSGEIREVPSKDAKHLRKIIENSKNFDLTEFHSKYRALTGRLENTLETISKKFPSDANTQEYTNILNELKNLETSISSTIISPINNLIPVDDEDYLNHPTLTGVDEGSDHSTESEHPSNIQNQKLTSIRSIHPTLSLIHTRIDHNEIDLQPDFQRKDRIWPLKHKSFLVESILLGLPIPVFYFAEKNNGNWLIVDGLQRTTTLVDYINGEYKLESLTKLNDLNGKLFTDLERPDQRQILEYEIQAHLIGSYQDNDSMVRELFQRINTYGVSLSAQEIRSALNPGDGIKFLRYIAESTPFNDVTKGSIAPRRMKDMELCLGILAYIFLGYKDYNHVKYDDFLVKALKKINSLPIGFLGDYKISEDEKLPKINEYHSNPIFIDLYQGITNSFSLATEIFGENRFRKPGSRNINKQLFELICSAFYFVHPSDRKKLIEESTAIQEALELSIKNDSREYASWSSETYTEFERGFLYSISQSTGKKATILYRFDFFINLIKETTGVKIEMNGFLKEFSDDQ